MDHSPLSLNTSLPFSEEAEKSVLGALFVDPIKLASLSGQIDETDFYKSRHQTIYHAMTVIFDKTGSIDIVTLADQLKAYDQFDNVGGHDYLLELMQFTPTAAHIDQYAQIVRTKSILRQLVHASQKIANLALDEGDDVNAIIDDAEALILSIGEGNQSNRPRHIRPIIKEAYDLVLERSENQREIVGLPTGYWDLDVLTSGLNMDQLVILAARPSVGKTAFALNIAQNVATKSKIPVAIFSLEMGAVDLVNRMICAEGNINASNLRTGNLTNDEWNSFTIATDTLREAPIFIDDSAGSKVSEIRAKCRRLKQEHPDLGLIVIDYLQLIEGSGRENRQQEVSEISRQLKKLAKELETPVMALSQLSRGLEHRQNKRPMLADIRESGSIEQDADIVMFLYREDYHQHDEEPEDNPSDLPDNTIEVILAKNRNGALGTIKLLFKRDYNKFSSLTYAPPPPR